jgi:hypothetical protein
MIDPWAGCGRRGWVLLVLLVCLALPLVGGCSSDPECLAAPYLPQCFDDDEEKTEDTATQTSVREQARAEDIDTTMAALRQTLVGTAVTTAGEVHRHRNERSLSLHFLSHDVVHREDGGHWRGDGVNRARRSSLEASSAEGDRLDADTRPMGAGPRDALDVMPLLNDAHVRPDCWRTRGDARAMASAPETGD